MSSLSRLSHGIFDLDRDKSKILFDYIDFSFLDIKTYNISSQIFDCLNCCKNDENYESVIPFSPKDLVFKDNVSEWLYDLSLYYIRMSGIDCSNLRIYSIEFIRSSGDLREILIENSNAATVVFHFDDKSRCYVTTHKNKFSYLAEDRKCIITVFERL